MGRSRSSNFALGLVLTLVLFVVVAAMSVAAQQVKSPQDRQIDSDYIKEAIDSVSVTLNEYYVYPKVAKKMEAYVRKQLKAGRYNKTTSARDFYDQLTEDLREISKDRHLGTRYFTDEQIKMFQDTVAGGAAQQKELEHARRENFGFKELQILDGNIGYLDLRSFSETGHGAEEVAVAAMNYLANSDAIIIDLRQNGGGSPDMIGLISSYFFDEPVHLNTFYLRRTDSLRQFWTTHSVEGPKLTDKDLYLLTSHYTFSAAEEFTYNLKNLKRATIVGETTGGGAHPVEDHFFANLNLGLRVPMGRAINPVSGTNWEGVGVTPDIAVPADAALDRAHLEALKLLHDKVKDEDRLNQIDWTITSLETKNNPISVNLETLNSYVGTYGPRHITVEDGTLYYQRDDRPKMAAIPLADNLFMFSDIDYFRIRFDKDENGKVHRIIGIYEGGQQDANEKDSDT